MPNVKNRKQQFSLIEQMMKRDLFTVLDIDLIDLVANIMNERNIRHVPVENEQGILVGLVSSKQLIQYYSSKNPCLEAHHLVKDIMVSDLVTVSGETTTLEAIQLMEKNHVSFLPVLKDKKLVGLVTEYDFLKLTTFLLYERHHTVPIPVK